jgi:hypothetical protein
LNMLENLIESLEIVDANENELLCSRLTQLNDLVRAMSNEQRRYGMSDRFYGLIHKQFAILSESKNTDGLITLMKTTRNSSAAIRDSMSSTESKLIERLILFINDNLSELINADSLSSSGFLTVSLQYIFNLAQGIAKLFFLFLLIKSVCALF